MPTVASSTPKNLPADMTSKNSLNNAFGRFIKAAKTQKIQKHGAGVPRAVFRALMAAGEKAGVKGAAEASGNELFDWAAKNLGKQAGEAVETGVESAAKVVRKRPVAKMTPKAPAPKPRKVAPAQEAPPVSSTSDGNRGMMTTGGGGGSATGSAPMTVTGGGAGKLMRVGGQTGTPGSREMVLVGSPTPNTPAIPTWRQAKGRVVEPEVRYLGSGNGRGLATIGGGGGGGGKLRTIGGAEGGRAGALARVERTGSTALATRPNAGPSAGRNILTVKGRVVEGELAGPKKQLALGGPKGKNRDLFNKGMAVAGAATGLTALSKLVNLPRGHYEDNTRSNEKKPSPSTEAAASTSAAPRAGKQDNFDWLKEFKRQTGTVYNPKSRMDQLNMARLKTATNRYTATLNRKEYRELTPAQRAVPQAYGKGGMVKKKMLS